MGQLQHPINRQFFFSDDSLAAVFEAFDDLHNAASEGELDQVTELNKRELVGWLRDLVYTAQETIQEIEKHAAHQQPTLRLVK
jgi:hypothetical protein